MLGYIARSAVRSAARNSGQARQGKAPEWQPFTKLVWAVFVFGIPIAIGGPWRVGAFVILGLIVASVVAALVYAVGHTIAHRNDEKTAPKQGPEDRLLADLFGEPQHKQGSTR